KLPIALYSSIVAGCTNKTKTNTDLEKDKEFKNEVSNLNTKELAQLPDDSYFFVAHDEEKFSGQSAELARSCLAAAELELKVGSQ
ncbi:13839_t:CDS:2, partial [Gigaspora rosea]